jgi:hypothetical protein
MAITGRSRARGRWLALAASGVVAAGFLAAVAGSAPAGSTVSSADAGAPTSQTLPAAAATPGVEAATQPPATDRGLSRQITAAPRLRSRGS